MAALLAITGATAQAAIIVTGTLQTVGDVDITAPGGIGHIHFSATTAPSVETPNKFQVTGATTGTFFNISGLFGNIQDLDQAVEPVNTTLSVPNFMTFPAPDSNYTFTLTRIPQGTFSPAQCGAPAAAGQTCTPPGTPFNLSNQTATSSIASFEVDGLVLDGGVPVNSFKGTFSTQFTNIPYQSLLATISAGGHVFVSESANFVFDVVPEPANILLALGGLLIIGGSIARKKRA